MHLLLSDEDKVWRVNTNGGAYFKGRIVNTKNRFPKDRSASLQEQWIGDWVPDTDDAKTGYSYNIVKYSEHPDTEPFALVAGKHTEVVRLSPNCLPVELNGDMFSNDRAVAGIRAAYFSAAFLLQRLLADKLDIDPAEIDIADIVRKKLPNQLLNNQPLYAAEIILTDVLPNGSGFVRNLFDNIDSVMNTLLTDKTERYVGKLLSDTHNCDSACYDCLKGYRNMNYHGLLDWRLGMSLLRLLL